MVLVNSQDVYIFSFRNTFVNQKTNQEPRYPVHIVKMALLNWQL
uniref:Uncharacterized protein n=1 Tax=Anguilla anguilla TaxID=7936 RepID=A0A0E9WI86_ANGAN